MTLGSRSLPARRIGLAGPMLGGNEGWVTSQHEVLARRFTADGSTVLSTSSEPRRLRRMLDTLVTVSRWKGRVDVIVIAVFSGPGFWIADATSRLAAARGIPQILVLHGGNLPSYSQRHPRRVDRCFERANGIVAPSRYLVEELASRRTIHVIPNVFDLDGIAFQHRRTVRARLLWMRTFHEIYNPLLAIEAFATVKQTHPDATLTMAGQEKGLQRDCKDRAAELGLSDSIRFPGFLDEVAKRQAFRDHDVFVNTNDVDNTPVSVLEAAAAGLPVVATAVGGIPYLFEDHRSALLVPPGDPVALADGIHAVLTDPTLAETLSTEGRALAARSAWEHVGRQWSELISTVGEA